jgi:hypothetical protein
MVHGKPVSGLCSSATATNSPLVLFRPRDGSRRGDVIDMAQEVARAGCRVHGWDIKGYLEGFTGATQLTESDTMNDIGMVAAWISLGQPQKVILIGCSQG